MPTKVYAYSSIAELRNHPRYKEISAFPQITATGNMCAEMKSFYPEIENIIDIHVLQSAVVQDWSRSSTALGLYINTGNLIRKMTGVPENLKPLHESFLKSRKDVVNAIRSLVEADIYPDDIVPVNNEEKLFKAIWEKAEETDLDIGRFRGLMNRYASDNGYFTETVYKSFPCMRSDTVVLNGFYYITAMQERIFDLLEKAGKTLIFTGHIDPSMDNVNETWRTCFSMENGFPAPSDWIFDNPEASMPNGFGKAFDEENWNSGFTKNKIKIIKYRNEAGFISDVKRIVSDGYNLYSTNKKKIEAILKEIYPEKFRERHLLSYPVGQYFYTLHSMWDKRSGKIKLSGSDIQVCLSSGWVVYEGHNGKDYSRQVEKILPFFSGCEYLEDWQQTMSEYKYITGVLNGYFESHIKDLPEENARYHRIMANPFRNFSCFDLEPEDVEIVSGLVTRLADTAEYLFGSGNEINISEHFAKIRKIIEEGSGDDRLYEEEKAIVGELAERISDPKMSIARCLPEDISDAVMMIIGGGIFDEDSFEFNAASEEKFVRSLVQIETAPLATEGKIHLCLCDETRLPSTDNKPAWPLSVRMLRAVLPRLSGRRSRYLEDMLSIIENPVLSDRYLFCTALQNKEIELSWIAEEDGKDVAMSPYLLILQNLFDCPVTEKTTDKIVEIKGDTTGIKLPSISYRLDDIGNREMRYDAALCPWKYIYGYLCNEAPSFSSDFHYRFVLSSLVRVFANLTGMRADEVAENVLECFPYLKKVEKRQIRDYYTQKNEEYAYASMDDPLDGVGYTGLRLLPHFIKMDLIQKAEDEIEDKNGTTLVKDLSAGVDSYHLCQFCQFRDDCTKARREADEQ